MKKRTPSLEPQKVSESVWYYESRYPAGLIFVVEHRDMMGLLIGGRPIQFIAPTKMLRASLARMPKKGKKR